MKDSARMGSKKKVAGASSSTAGEIKGKGGPATLVPKLRFPEFREAEGWKDTPLQTIARPVSDRAVTGEGDNVLSLSGEHGLVLQSDYFGKKVAGESAERYLKLLRNDFVYNDRTTKASTFGTIKRLSKYEGGIVSPIYKCFRFHADENPIFWEWYFESGRHDAALGGLVNEGARAGRFNISISQFLSTNARRPDELEQQKIAECLSSLDDLIVAQARKLDALKTHKKGLMQQLFPREGETQPRLRFPEFRDAGKWVAAPLGQLLVGSPDYGVNAAAVPFSEQLPKYLRITDISEDGTYLSDKMVSVDIEPTEGNYLDEDDIALARTGASVGKSYRYRKEDGRLVFAGFLIRIKPAKKKLISAYLANFLTTDVYWDWVAVTSTRSGQPGINSTEYSSLTIPLPPGDLAEQQRIASCLTSLDDLIAAQTQTLEALKTHKRGLMQQLFPAPEPNEG